MKQILVAVCFVITTHASAQNDWHVCNAPVSISVGRVDDIFMVNAQVGYAATSSGKVLKSTDAGENWTTILDNNSVYNRSIEFTSTQKGFVGSFKGTSPNTVNILRRTTDGGVTWTDLTMLIDPRARFGICGLAAPDSNTIYGAGNWFMDEAYIIKSTDGGNSWSFIDMSAYATSLIDMHFINKDTGFATGKGRKPQERSIILYTTDGGVSWTKKYEGLNRYSEYCWKIQRLTERIYFASIEQLNTPLTTALRTMILRSDDGGMNWNLVEITPKYNRIQGVGFINPKKGWAGGGYGKSFETNDGGITWDSIAVCPLMNRVFRMNDSTVFATGNQIWKYKGNGTYPAIAPSQTFSLQCLPNPVKNILTVNVGLLVPTHMKLMFIDASGRILRVMDNTDRPKGSYQFYIDTSPFPAGAYHVVLMTHEDHDSREIIVVK